jgi:hypothetical protein
MLVPLKRVSSDQIANANALCAHELEIHVSIHLKSAAIPPIIETKSPRHATA